MTLTNAEKYNQAISYFSENNFENSLNLFYELSLDEPSSELYHHYIGLIYFKLEDFKKSSEHFSNALKINENLEESLHYRALSNIQLLKTSDVIKDIEHCINLNHNNTKIFKEIFSYLINFNHFAEAEEIIKFAINKYSNYSDLYLFYGIIKSYRKRKKEKLLDAINIFSKAIELDPNNHEAYLMIGLLYIKLNLINKAHECLIKANSINPNFNAINGALITSHFKMGDQLLNQKSYTEAIHHFNSSRQHYIDYISTKSDPDSIECLYKIDYTDFIKFDNDISSEIHLKMGIAFFETNEINKSLLNINESILTNYFNQLNYNTSENFNDNNDDEKEFNPEDQELISLIEAFYYRAKIHMALDETYFAINDLKTILYYDTQNDNAHCFLKKIISSQKKFEEYYFSKEIKKSLIELKYCEIINDLLSKKQYQKALLFANQLLYFNPTYYYYYYLRATINDNLNYHMALTDYKTALKFNPNHIDSLFRFAVINYEHDENEIFDDITKKIKILSPKSNVLSYLEGLKFFLKEKYSKAITSFNNYIQYYPNDYNAYYYKSISYKNLGQPENAINDLITISKLDLTKNTIEKFITIARDTDQVIIEYQLLKKLYEVPNEVPDNLLTDNASDFYLIVSNYISIVKKLYNKNLFDHVIECSSSIINLIEKDNILLSLFSEIKDIYYYRARSFVFKNDFLKANNDFHVFIELYNTIGGIDAQQYSSLLLASYYYCSYLNYKLEKYNQSIKYLNEMIKLFRYISSENDFLSSIYSIRGHLLSLINLYNEAIDDFNKAIELKSNYYLPYYLKGIFLLNSKDYFNAIDCFEKSLKYKSNLAEIFYLKSLTHHLTNEFEKSNTEFNHCLLLDKNCIIFYENHGLKISNNNLISVNAITFEPIYEINFNYDVSISLPFYFNFGCDYQYLKPSFYSILNKFQNPIGQLRSNVLSQSYFSDRLINGQNFLMLASFFGECHLVETLHNYLEINTRDINGWYPIMLSAFSGNYEITISLIEKGSNLDFKFLDVNTNNQSQDGYEDDENEFIEDYEHTLDNLEHRQVASPLILSIYKKHDNIINLLLDRGANVNITDSIKRSALMYASFFGTPDLLNKLINLGAQINYLSEGKYIALDYAIFACNIENIKLLIKNNSNINNINMYYESSLMIACQFSNIDVVRFLVNSGANQNYITKFGDTPISSSILARNFDIAKYLISLKTNQRHNHDLDYAAASGNINLFLFMLDNGYKITYRTLILSAIENSIEILEYILKNSDLDVNVNNYKAPKFLYNPYIGFKVLTLTAYAGKYEATNLLIKSSANVNIIDFIDSKSTSPLIEAIRNKHPKVAKLLIDNSANVNFQNDDGYTPLIFATLNNDIESIKCLLEFNANKNIKCRRNKMTAYDYANQNGFLEIAKLLI